MVLILERPTYLILRKQCFYGKECGQAFTAKISYKENRLTISNDVNLLVVRKLTNVVALADIAKSILITLSIVHRYFKDLGESVKT